MARRKIRTVTDPATLRALAHPLRLALLDLLDREGELTATRAAELTGENSANCSFHLRQLAKHGFVEPAASPDARSRPWRRTSAGERVPTTRDRRTLAASAAVGALILERLASEARAFWAGAADDVAWQDASFMTSDTLHLTCDELRELARDVSAAIERRAAAHRTGRAGTRPVRAAAALFPLAPLE
jgi:DNA-binding transcriptional ArsR family regulator